MNCAYHPGNESVGVCTCCGKFVCEECRVDYQGKIVCKDCLSSGRTNNQSNAGVIVNNVQQQPYYAPVTARRLRDKVTAGVLALLLGSFGAHHFYLGNTGLGILYLIFCWTGIPTIAGIIEGIIYLCQSDEDWQRKFM